MNSNNTQQLLEIKKGHTGTGLLIENDGHILSNQDIIKQINEDIDNHDKFVIPDHFVVDAILQKYDIVNANGRIYPKNVLVPQVEKYQREKVDNRCALGSLDHPNCQLADTQILTEKGWKMIPDVKVGDNILTLRENDDIEVNPVYRKIEEDYEGKVLHITGRFIDITVTPNHKFPIYGRNKKFKGLYTAQELFEGKVPDQSHSYIPKSGNWTAKSDKYFTISPLPQDMVDKLPNNTLKEKYSKPLEISMDIFMKFMGIYLSEGCTKLPGAVLIYQKKDEVCNEIREMLNDFPLSYSERIVSEESGEHCFYMNDMRLAAYTNQFGLCYDKYVPFEIKKQGKDMLQIFYDWFVMGDGRKRGIGNGSYYSDDVFSTSKRLIMDLNEIQLKIGYCGSYHEEDRHIDRYMGERLIRAENSHNMHFTFRQLNKFILLHPKSFKITEEDYKGKVYCVEVKNHTFYTMCKNGKCLWSGNSSAISGHDISHNIIEMHWENRTLLGKLELNITPGYRKMGICSSSGDMAANLLLNNYRIGVSSRGVGSVNNMPGGKLIVGDDYEVICWDIVIEPSTKMAIISLNPSDLEQYVESNQEKSNKPLMTEGMKDIYNLLS